MHFFDGKLGAFERMMKEKPNFHRRNGNGDKSPPPKKKTQPKPPPPDTKKKGATDSE